MYKLLTIYRPAYGDCSNGGISSKKMDLRVAMEKATIVEFLADIPHVEQLLDDMHILADALEEATGWNWLDDEIDPPHDVVVKINRALAVARKRGVLI